MRREVSFSDSFGEREDEGEVKRKKLREGQKRKEAKNKKMGRSRRRSRRGRWEEEGGEG